MRQFARPAFVGALIIGAALLVAPSTAFAHASLQSSIPAANSIEEESPPAIVLNFDDAIEEAVSSIELFDSNGDMVDTGSPEYGDDESTLTASLPDLDDGLYAVIWRVTSADGHPIDGSFSFQIGTGTTGSGADLIERVSGGSESAMSVRWVYGIGRFLSLLGLVTTLGVGGWLIVGAGDRAWLRRFMLLASSTFVAGTLIAFAFFGAHASAGTAADAFDPGTWTDVASLNTGRALLLRALIGLTLVGLVVQWSRRQQRWWRAAAVTAGGLALATFPMSGHPNALGPRVLWFTVAFVHLAAVVVWVGGLIALLFLREERSARRFSVAAAVCVPLIVGTGALQVWKMAGSFSDVAATNWGRILLVKVTLVVVLLAFATVSRWLLLHDGVASIRRTVVVEASIGVLVLGLAAGLVALPPAPVIAAQPFTAQLASNGLIVEVSGAPGLVGANEIHIVVTPPGGSIEPVITVIARVLLESEGIPPSPVELVQESANHFSGIVTFPRAGDWTLEVIIQATVDETLLVKATISIR